MRERPRQILHDYIEGHPHMRSHPERCVAAIDDLCPEECKRERKALMIAVEEKVVEELLKPLQGTMPLDYQLRRLASRMTDGQPIEARAAYWAVGSWALALGRITREELDLLESDFLHQFDSRQGQPVLGDRNHSSGPSNPVAQPSHPPSAPPVIARPGEPRISPSTPLQPLHTPISVQTNAIDGAEMVLVSAGSFTMGGEKFPDETPVRQVYLDAYWIYRTPVTVAQFRAFCFARMLPMPPPPSWGWRDDHPIVGINRDEAQSYCHWAGVRLPTEAQWEKAARGVMGLEYPWGPDWNPTNCVASVSAVSGSLPQVSIKGTEPVGVYPQGASPFGALDMAGNVYEWCEDIYEADYYARAPLSNPSGPTSKRFRLTKAEVRYVARGGSWASDHPDYCRAAFRNSYPRETRIADVGFRCAIQA